MQIGYDEVKSYSKHENIFSKKALIFKVSKDAHFSLIAITYPEGLVQEVDNHSCQIFHLDSIKDYHNFQYLVNITKR
jgi:hypothetical protein